MNDISQLQEMLGLFQRLSIARQHFILDAMRKVEALRREGRDEDGTAFLKGLTEDARGGRL